MRRSAAQGRRGALAVALACAVAFGTGVAPGLGAAVAGGEGTGARAEAWADTPDNGAVPTDDTGVVDSSGSAAPEEEAGPAAARRASGAESPAGDAGADAAGDGTAGDGAAAGDAASAGDAAADDSAAGGATDEAAAAGADGSAGEDSPGVPQAIVPDPVFGSERNEKNLMNPQQKPDSSFIYDTSISTLQEADPYLNDQTVQVTGEVVGDRIKAEFDPGFCWIVLQGDDKLHTEVPVFLDVALTEAVDTYGAYGRKGTTLQVRGTFHLACPDHEGLTDLHADTVSVVSKGYVGEQELNPAAFLPGVVLVAVGLVLLLVFRHMREGQR